MADSRLASIHIRLVTNAVGYLQDNWPDVLVTLTQDAEFMAIKDDLVLEDPAGMAAAALGEARANGTTGVHLPGAEDLPEGLERIAIEEETLGVEATNGVEPPAEETPPATRPEIRNFDWEHVGNGQEGKDVRRHLERDEVLAQIFAACDPWPRRLGGDLVYETPSGECCRLKSAPQFMDFLKSRASVHWHKGENFYPREEAFCGACAESPVLSEWLDMPLEPHPKGAWLRHAWRNLPTGDGAHLRQLLARFNPDTTADAALIQALFLTPFWGGPPGHRPLFVITGPEGVGVQATGKTTLAEMVGAVAGGLVHLHPPGRHQRDSYTSQLLAAANFSSSIALIDNADELDLDELASLITTPTIHGRAAFQADNFRVNRLTFVVTAVSPQLSPDLASRAVFIHLQPPTHSPSWLSNISKFIASHHRQLVADCLACLSSVTNTSSPASTRFPEWAQLVLASHSSASDALTCQAERSSSSDSHSMELGLFLEALLASDNESFKVQELTEIWNQATGKKLPVPTVGIRLKQLDGRGKLPKWFFRSSRKSRGARWYVNRELVNQIEG